MDRQAGLGETQRRSGARRSVVLLIPAVFAFAGTACRTRGAPNPESSDASSTAPIATTTSVATSTPGVGGAAGSPGTSAAGGFIASSGGAPSSVAGAASSGASGHSTTGAGGGSSTGGAPSGGGASVDAGTGHAPDASTVATLHVVTSNIDVPVGAELFRCFHARVPSATDVDAVGFASKSTGINELTVFRDASDTLSDGTMTTGGCSSGTWTYAAYADDYALRLPDGVGEHLVAGQPLLLDMHLVNTTSADFTSHVALDIQVATGSFTQAAALVGFNTSIAIPAHGVQTVSGDCTLPATTKLFSMTTHTNRLAKEASVTRKLASGQLGEVLVRTTDATHPAVAEWNGPFLTLMPGEKLHYSCSYENDGASAVTVGTSAFSNEMCMNITYFFPASTGVTCN